MSTKSATTVSHRLQLLSMIIVLLAISVSTQGRAATTDGTSAKRSSVTSQIRTGGRNGNSDGRSSTDEYDALITTGKRSAPSRAQRSSKFSGTAAVAGSTSADFWIFDADIQLFSDDDNDGYFYGIDLLFDADTVYSIAEVYAVVYLSYEGGPWNEYATTEDFTLFGASSDDEYVLITELMSGYQTGDYDVLIELFDAYDSSFLASLGPEDSAALAFLPLEDFTQDAPLVTASAVAVSHGGGGAADVWMLLVLLLLLLARHRQRVYDRRTIVATRRGQAWASTSGTF